MLIDLDRSREMNHSLGLRVVAEGVERADHYGFLVGAGCDVVQGYVISHLQPAEALDLDALGRHPVAPPMPVPSRSVLPVDEDLAVRGS